MISKAHMLPLVCMCVYIYRNHSKPIRICSTHVHIKYIDSTPENYFHHLVFEKHIVKLCIHILILTGT